jgi:hypothetical protein
MNWTIRSLELDTYRVADRLQAAVAGHRPESLDVGVGPRTVHATAILRANNQRSSPVSAAAKNSPRVTPSASAIFCSDPRDGDDRIVPIEAILQPLVQPDRANHSLPVNYLE